MGHDLDAIILAGGRAARLGGARKPLLTVGGTGLLEGTIAAAKSAGAQRVVVAADPVRADAEIVWVREDPAFGGPVAGIEAALAHVEAVWTLVLACDLPRIRDAVPLLVAAIPEAADGVYLTDAAGRPQWLTAVYRTSPLRAAVAALPDGAHGAPVRAITAAMTLSALTDPDDVTADVDTWEDLKRARRAHRKEPL